MVLTMTRDELDPVCDSLAPVIALAHALWDSLMPQATMAKCVRTAQLEQRNIARPWTAVNGQFGAAVATLKRMQWTRGSCMILSCDACMMAGSLIQEGSARTACTLCSRRRRGRGDGGAQRCMRSMRALTLELS